MRTSGVSDREEIQVKNRVSDEADIIIHDLKQNRKKKGWASITA